MILRGLCRAELRLAETDLFNLNVVLNIPDLCDSSCVTHLSPTETCTCPQKMLFKYKVG